MSTSQQLPSKQTIYVCFTLLLWLILSPLMIRWTYQIWQNRRKLIMHKRYVSVSLVCCAMCITTNIITVPLDLHLFFANIPHLYSLSHAIISTVIHYCVFYLLSDRFYMLFFNVNWTITTLSSHWMIHIRKPCTKDWAKARTLQILNQTPNYIAMSAILPVQFCRNIDPHIVQEWCIKNQFKYGSPKNVHRMSTKIYVVTSGLYTCLSVLIYFFSNHQNFITLNVWQYLVDFVFFLLPCCIIIYLWTKTPNSHCNNGQFFFYQEMNKLFIIITMTCCLKLFLYIMVLYAKYTYSNSDECYFSLTVTKHMVDILCSFIIVYYQTRWVINKIEKQKQILNDNFHNKLFRLSLLGSEIYNNEKNTELCCDGQSDFKKQILPIILQSDHLLEVFVKYLSTEYCCELVFAFIELTQFKRLMERYNFIELAEYTNTRSDAHIECNAYEFSVTQPTPTYACTAVNLPNTISRSSLVHNKKYARMRGVYRYRKIAKKLSAKYVENGSIFELPISKDVKHRVLFKQRMLNALSMRYDSYEVHKNLYELYDECREEIYGVLRDSCDRFVKFGAFRQSIVVQKFGFDLAVLILSYLPSNGLY